MNLTSATGKILKEARVKKELGLVDVARKLQISVQMVCDVECGRKPLPDKYIDDWADAVGEDPDLIAVDIWQRRLNDFNRNRKSKRRICFKVVPVLEDTPG